LRERQCQTAPWSKLVLLLEEWASEADERNEKTKNKKKRKYIADLLERNLENPQKKHSTGKRNWTVTPGRTHHGTALVCPTNTGRPSFHYALRPLLGHPEVSLPACRACERRKCRQTDSGVAQASVTGSVAGDWLSPASPVDPSSLALRCVGDLCPELAERMARMVVDGITKRRSQPIICIRPGGCAPFPN
jgi:hypothetical protein